MIPKNRTSTHPGIVLLKGLLEPLGQSQKALAEHLGIPMQRINEVVRGKRGVTPETAWLLGEAFKKSPEFWLNLQATYDLSKNRPDCHIGPLARARA
jgi:addiction module HigA family antidote